MKKPKYSKDKSDLQDFLSLILVIYQAKAHINQRIKQIVILNLE